MSQFSVVTLNAQPISANTSPTPNAIPLLDAQAGLTVKALTGTVTTVTTLLVGVATYATSAAIATTMARANAAGGVMTLTLPAAATCTGQLIVIKKVDSSGNLVTVAGNGAELIDGSNTNTSLSAQYNTLRVVSNGTSWDIV